MISIIIVNYLQKDFLTKSVESIYKNLNSQSFEVIIVNNSNEDNLSRLKTTYPSLTIIDNENTGFAKANNLGVKHSKGSYLLFLNADTEVLSNFTEDLINSFQNKEFGAVGLKLQYEDGRFQNSFGLFPTLLNEYKNKKTELAFKNGDTGFINNLENRYSKIKAVDWVTGAAMFIRKTTFEKINGFDERFFLYYEDIDLCCRFHEKGYKNYFYPFSKIFHHKGEHARKDFAKDAYRIAKQSQLLYYRLHNNLIQSLMLKIYLKLKKTFT